MRLAPFLVVLACSIWLGPAPAAAEPRVALVIGNGAYDATLGPLANPARDAALVAASLEQVGFSVRILADADLKGMKRAISEFGQRLLAAGPDATGLFYFAGHGVQIEGVNYLLPLAATIATEADAEMEAVNADWVLKQMEFAGNRVNIVILDACRNNPLSRGLRSVTRGLARMDAPTGSFIAYATAPGEVALDGSDGNSPYSAALAAAIQGPPVPLEEMFRNVRVAVMAATGRRQVPWDSSSLTGAFYFSAAVEAAPAAVPTTVPAAAAEPVAEASDSRGGAVPPAPGSVFRDCDYCPEMVAIAPGGYLMGTAAGAEVRHDDEGPQHAVDIPAPFALSIREVTRNDYAAFVKATGRATRDCWYGDGGNGRMAAEGDFRAPGFDQAGDHPATCVSWEDAVAYAAWLSARSGFAYGLPTEAEWEYAARAGKTSTWPWGDDNPSGGCAFANGLDVSADPAYPGNGASACEDGFVHTAPVGSFAANGFGLHDMLGNVWEWVSDCYRPGYDGAPADGSALADADCENRVARGGSWLENPWDMRLARRYAVPPDGRENIIGFRLARDL
ncbi:formylglycine-generating enzyme required for sulfatase activity [Dongia mobilis]|uniref:Formylglycine-generating enzyme required for sulfatase activity n=1 Tax=Dongia mobilis TaxID=578943 RepID=A0A4R6WRS8_9PROT|nr:SUMF1/EgtB/PvdO family nonheme iron enzyme [Dongia mobilis]TDQ82546.1 formylglycine-generating enzyme required for sulfatase activity [Dongia mobilis]